MPFHPPFKQEFEPGDLVYGLALPRGRYPYEYPHFHQAHDCDPVSGVRQISRIDQYAAIRSEQWEQKCFNRHVPPNQAEFLASIKRHPKYKSVLAAQQATVKAVSRKCKAGLAWATNSEMSVHFILDRIDMEQVVAKSHPRDKDGASYTGCELRWIYRNRHHGQVQQCVQFWMNGSATLPPWEGRDASIWSRYKPSHESSSSPSMLSTLFGCWRAGVR
ncbi:hypothetical protein AKI39_03335 [Bordetella sp. H567]|uniref:hypothetical protein n=1 Tax=Bordetella sp. H567 TaxID=1697043 RepID=UPI00081CA681|nr:hypothetical protein [Bordetella sp. H567]AOB29928.1 hypothetical protein AKI39_03335 [Bordetella sp. H567]